MELAFLTNAVRRYYWVILLGALVGLIPGLLARSGGPGLYESRAVILVAPPSQSLLQVNLAGDPDRYVSGQLSVLRSQALSERVAETLGEDVDRADVTNAVRFDQEPLTDVVLIVASTEDPERSQAIAAAYVDVYFNQLRAQLDGSQEPDLERIDAEIATLRAELDEVDERMLDVMQPFLARNPIPDLEQVAPGLISEKAILLNEFEELQAARSQLSNGLQVASQVVQDATLPSEASGSSSRPLLVVGLIGGLFVGVLAAALAARLSSNVLGDDQAEEILAHPVVGSLPVLSRVRSDRRSILDEPSREAALFYESLCVRAEASAQGRDALCVVVTGTESGAGVTTLAAGMARRFAGPAARVLLIDGDSRDPELTSLFLLGGRTNPPEEPGVIASSVPNLSLTTLTMLAEMSGSADDRKTRRPDVAELVATAFKHADVLVFDGGALLSSVTTVQLRWLADAVVLAMPQRQQIRSLEVAAAELGNHQHLLPVWTPAGRIRGPRRWLGRFSRRGR